MTQPNVASRSPGETAGNDHPPPSPEDCLLHLLLSLLAPMFLLGSVGDIRLARMAALGTINAYRARDNGDLISVAQVIAFGLGALGSLSLSMGDDLSLNMILRLRGNANACNRSAEQNRRALHQDRPVGPHASPPDAPPPPARQPEPQAPEPQTLDSPAQAAVPASAGHQSAMAREQWQQAMWAAAMATVAEECAAELPNLPPEERELATMRANALNYCIEEFSSGSKSPPGPALTGPPRPCAGGSGD